MWSPENESDIESAIANGLIGETGSLEMKREIESTPAGNKEAARDLASFAIDGGSILVGVAEDKAARSFAVAPQPLDGLAERIEQIAALAIDPPLLVRPRDIPTESDSTVGYVLVEIPPSAIAPHAVSGVYYGRGERTRRRLSDADVRRLHSQRQDAEAAIVELVDTEIARNMVPLVDAEHGHLHLVARPIGPSHGIIREFARAANNTPAFNFLAGVETELPAALREFEPSPRGLQTWSLRADGAAMTQLAPGTTRIANSNDEKYLLDIEFHEDGQLSAMLGRLTDFWNPGTAEVIFDIAAVAYSLRLVLWSRSISRMGSYRGAWTFALAGVGLQGKFSAALMMAPGFNNPVAYERDRYTASTTAHFAEIEDHPEAIANRLAGNLLRGLGSAQNFAQYFEPSSGARAT